MKADMCSARAHVRYGLIADIESAARSTYGFLGMPPSANFALFQVRLREVGQ